jgi:hypothetical protein
VARYDLNYEPWQRKMVDPNHPAGAVKFGVRQASPAGENMLLGGLPGIGLTRLPIRGIPSVFKKQLSPRQLLKQMKRQLGRTEPRMYPPVKPVTTVPHHIRHILRPQYGGRRGTRFRQEYRRAGTTADDLKREMLDRQKRAWVQTRSGTYINPDDILR